jgi:hypothetical protein
MAWGTLDGRRESTWAEVEERTAEKIGSLAKMIDH